MAFKDFVKSIWFPIIVFIILEIIFFIIGFNIKLKIHCDCAAPPCICPPGGNVGLVFLLIGLIPSAIISLIAYVLIKRLVK